MKNKFKFILVLLLTFIFMFAFAACNIEPLPDAGLSLDVATAEKLYKYTEENNKITLVKYIGDRTNEIEFPAKIGGKTVVAIAPQFFYCKDFIEKITIPSSITSIGDAAFAFCWNLKYISLPKYLTSISDNMLSTTSIESITIPPSVTKIGKYAFADCSELQNITMSSNINFIDERAFAKCTKLESFAVPSEVTSIGAFAFSGCSKLKNITFEQDSKLTHIGEYAFFVCESLDYVILPPSVATIDYQSTIEPYTLTLFCKAQTQPSTWDSSSILYNCFVYWYSPTKPTTNGDYWHYVNEKPTIWQTEE